jgi:HD-like signal output (HDOD) protein
MIKWIKNLFSSKKNDKKEAPVKESTMTLPVVEEETVKASLATLPVSVTATKQPLTVLKKLAPIRDLEDRDIEQLDQHLLVYQKNSTLFVLGEKSEQVFYLLKGSVEIQSNGGASYAINSGTPLAHLPLNCGKVCGATATTQTPCQLLSIPTSVVYWWANKSRMMHHSSAVEIIDLNLPEEIPHTQFFESFTQAYRENKLSLPSLPQVAVKLRKAMDNPDIGVKDVITIVQVDAPIVAKLIQVANSALYAPTTPIKNCHDAVTRLGLETTRKLVMGISVKQLFQTKSPKLMSQMQGLWKKSLHVSSLSFVLAQESGVVNPEDALLAGLVCDIGAIPLLYFAEQYPGSYPDPSELQKVMPYLNPPVGMLVLSTLGFSDEITEIPQFAENWYYESGRDELTLIDVVILAKLHSYFGMDHAKDLPHINSIPAYAKLRNGKLNADFSLDILVKAQQRIDAAMSVFA